MDYVNELRQNVVDLVYRSKQNNVVIRGILEGVEDEDEPTGHCPLNCRHAHSNVSFILYNIL